MQRESLPQLSFSRGTLILAGLTARERHAALQAGNWSWDPRVDAWRADSLNYPVLREQLRNGRFRLNDQVPGWQRVKWPSVDLPELRPDQVQAVQAWKQSLRGVIVMPTGTGKTEVALEIMRAAAVSTLIVAPVRDLMYQWHRRIQYGLGFDAGIVGDNEFRVEAVSVTTYDSAYIHMDRLGNRFALIIFDECHHLPAPVRCDAARMSAAPLRLGLSATPDRSDGRHVDLDALIGPRVFEIPLQLARGHTLADYEIVRIPVRLTTCEQSLYNTLSRQVARYVNQRRRTKPDFT
jgi:superfamily II DNA or RNA helicase